MAIGQSNDPNFNIQNPQDNQSLVYDSSTQTFINANVSSSNGSITGGANVGTGAELFKGLSGTDMQFRSLVAGSGVTLTQNTNDITITADQDITGAENLGTGEEIFLSVANSSIRLKSLSTTANTGIDLSSSNTEIAINIDPANINALSLANSNVFLQKSDNLFSLTNVGTARTNLDVYSKSEVDANFLKVDTANNQILPSVDNQLSLGNNSKRFSDVYAVSFHGTVSVAGTAQSISNHDLGDLGDVDTGTISTNNVLSWNGSSWVPSAISTLSSNDSLLKANNLSDLTDVADARNNLGVYSQSTSDAKYFQKGATNLPDTDNTYSLGSNSKRFSDIYAVSFHGTATSAGTVGSLSGHDLTDLDNVNTTGASNGHVLTYNGSAWISSAASSTSTLSGLTDVEVGGVANGQVLQYNSANAQWEAGSISSNSATTTFVDLTDTPTNYSGAAGYFLKVNSGGSAIEFTADPGYVSDLSSFTTDNLTEGSTNEYYTDAKADGRIASASIGDLADVDVSGVSANNVLSWNGSAFVPSTVSSGGVALTDFSVTTGSASGSGSLTYDNTTGVYTYRPADLSGYQTTANAFDGAFGSLTGTPTTVSGYGITDAFDGEYSSLANTPTLFDGEYSSLANTPTTVSGYGITDALTSVALNDVTDVDTANVTDGQALVYVSANAQWEPGTVASAYGDSNVSALLNGNVDTHIIPDTDVTYDLGSSTYRFRDLYLSGTTIDLGGTTLQRQTGTGRLLWNGTEVQDYNNLRNLPDLSGIPQPGSNQFLRKSSITVTTDPANGGGSLSYDNNGGFTFEPADLSGYQTTAGLNAAIDSHLNQSNPTSGYVLSWNGTDYAWVAQSGGITDTDSLPEGSTNEYYTDAKVDARITAAGVTGTKVTNWDTAHSWGDHSTAGYLTSYTETNDLTANVTWANVPDAYIKSSSVVQHQANLTITESQISDLQSYLTSETSHADVVVDGDFTSQGIMLRGASAGSYSILTDNSANWNTAYGWGDHSTAGYLTSYTETDPVFSAHTTSNITNGSGFLKNNGSGTWTYDSNTYLTAETNDLTSAVTWANVPDVNITSSSVTQHQGNLTITESQISDLSHYTDSDVDSRITSNWLVDEDNMASDSATKIPSQQSVKAYVDSQVATANELGEMTDVTLTSLANNQFLRYNANSSIWENASVTPATAAGSNTYVQFNDGGVMGSDADLTYNKTSNTLSVVNIDMGTNTFNDTNVGNWDTAYGWGDHSTQGYLTAETNDLSSAVTWANVPDVNITSSSVVQHQANLTITESQISDLQSYLTAEADTLATVTGRGATTTTTAVIPFYYANQAAFPNATTYHGAIAHSHSDGAMYFAHGGSWNKMANDSQLTNSTNWDTAYGWGDHSTAGYLTSVSSSDVTAHQGNITITESQISDLGSYLTGITGENLTDLSDVDTVSASDDGKYLYYDHSTTSFKWATVSGGTSYTDSDVDAHLNRYGVTGGYVLSWNGTDYTWVAQSGGVALTDLSITTASAFGNGSLAYNSGTGVFTFTPPLLTSYLENITNEDLGDLQDVSVGSATDGQVLTYVSANAAWEPTTVSSGGGGSAGTEYEEFKLNYATDGTLSGTSNLSSGISSVTIDSASGGDVTITFTGYSTPPLSVMFYGYNYASNEYNMNTLGSTGTTLRKVPGGGSSGSPTAFGSFSSLSIKVREAETGAGRSFGTTTHAWIRFVMGA